MHVSMKGTPSTASNVCFTDEKDENINPDTFMLMCSGRAVKLDVDEVGESDLSCFGGKCKMTLCSPRWGELSRDSS